MPTFHTLYIRLAEHDADLIDVDNFTQKVEEELLELDIETAGRPVAEAPQGARAIDPSSAGELVIGLLVTKEILLSIVNAISQRVAERPHRTAKLSLNGDELELGGISANQQQELIDAWISRQAHGRP